jgi:hypothetical protein
MPSPKSDFLITDRTICTKNPTDSTKRKILEISSFQQANCKQSKINYGASFRTVHGLIEISATFARIRGVTVPLFDNSGIQMKTRIRDITKVRLWMPAQQASARQK